MSLQTWSTFKYAIHSTEEQHFYCQPNMHGLSVLLHNSSFNQLLVKKVISGYIQTEYCLIKFLVSGSFIQKGEFYGT